MPEGSTHTLRGWPEDRLPVCSLSACGREIANGSRYVIPAGSILMLCLDCAQSTQRLESAQRAAAQRAAEQAQRVKDQAWKQRQARLAEGGLSGSERARRAPRRPSPPLSTTPLPAPAICPVCAEPFTPRPYSKRRGDQVYCSVTCFNRRNGPGSTIPCPICGHMFYPASQGTARERKRFCSQACAARDRSRGPLPPAVCPGCSVTFFPRPYSKRRGVQIYCSVTCSNRRTVGARDIPCPICATPFYPASRGVKGRQKFCSYPCAMKGREHERTHICPVCTRAYTPTRRRTRRVQVYCSKSCRWYGQRGRPNPSPPPLRWAGQYDGCVCCGRSDQRHRGRGRCPSCYRKLMAGVDCSHSPAEAAISEQAS